MNILMVSDSSDTSRLGNNVKQDLRNFLQKNGHKVVSFDIKKEDMHYCIGCFTCWLKTPGKCVFDDISSDINKAYIESDIAIFISPVKYGCYTPAIRRTMDRLIPNILPFFKKINGEMHHAPRYNKYPNFVTFGFGEDITAEEEDTFLSLSNANAVNLQSGKAQTYMLKKETDLTDTITSFGKYIKECAM